MRKYSIISAFFAVLLGFSVTAVFSVPAPAYACAPGCDCSEDGIEGALERRAEAKRVEHKAQAREHIKMNDNAPGMTCFDRALAMTQQLGNIFSDVAPGFVPPRSTDVFVGGSSFPDMGLSNWLGVALNDVVTPTLQAHVSNFADSLSAALGAAWAGYMDQFVNTILGPLVDGFNAIGGPIDEINNAMATINGWYTTIQGILDALGGTMPAAIPAILGTVTMLWNQIQGLISSAMSAVLSAINTIVSQIQSAIDAVISDLLNQFMPGGDCERIAKLWGGVGVLGLPDGFRSLIGTAVELGTPYFTIYDMLEDGNVAGAGEAMLEEFGLPVNSTILNAAFGDIDTGGILAGPGVLPTWPDPPDFNLATDGTAEIIQAMLPP